LSCFKPNYQLLLNTQFIWTMRTLLNNTLLLSTIFFYQSSFSQGIVDGTLGPPVVTSQFNEYAPSVSADGKTLIFESNKLGGWKLFESKLGTDGLWSEPKSIVKINSKVSSLIGGPSISYDGNTLFFFAYYGDTEGKADIYYSTREGDEWGIPVNIGKPINTEEYEGFPSLSADGKKLYFIRPTNVDRPDKVVCYKIYVSTKGKNGKWQEPVLVPYPINQDCEKSPRIMSDNKTIYFSSVREGGQGDFDLYRSQITETGEWSPPQALTFINTPQSDQFASVSASGSKIFYNTNEDIYTATIPPKFRQQRNITVQGFVNDFDTKKPLAAKIIIKDAITTETLTEVDNNESDGRYTVVLTAGRKYEVKFYKKDYSSVTLNYDLLKLKDYREEGKNIELFSEVNFLLSVNDKDLYTPLDADIRLTDAETKETYKAIIRKAHTGKYKIILPVARKYHLEISSKEHKPESFSLDLSSTVLYKNLEKDADLEALKKEYVLNVKDSENKKGLSVKIKIKNLDLNEEIETVATAGRDGRYVVNLREGNRYSVEISNNQGYAFVNEKINVNDQPAPELNIEILPIKPGAKLLLKEIYFEFNSYELYESSFEEINRVVDLMKQNPKAIVEVAAHTDNKGSDQYNMNLSQKRAQFVVDYMISQEILPGRLIAKGYGETQPIVANDTEEHMLRNRRLELKVLQDK
jgi:outer membrane protein OmpA-like peptidoglycan-associated protein/Tol biopolymer transport system component